MREVKTPNWLENLPLAPEYYPTDTEFADPIAYISKIEKEASKFGICKVIPPLPKPSRKFVIWNLNKSLAKRPELAPNVKLNKGCDKEAVFTTRQQELGHNGKKSVRKQVWQSGEAYTLEQFESKSKNFARSQLGDVKSVTPLVVESLFWETACEKPIYVEYANDVPGSGFGESSGSSRYLNTRNRRIRNSRRNCGGSCSNMRTPQSNLRANGEEYVSEVEILSSNQDLELPSPSRELEGSAGWQLSDSSWNLQVIARSIGSLTRFMPDDIPGVTSPMVYIGMLFSWFAWHVEDHELHSMNFLHTGSQKTWYAVPGECSLAFEEVIRTQAYGENVDLLAALTMLGEKTTLLSPEVLVDSGIPCCRLVQNPGEFVITFPRAYHVGFSHGFNCGEAANFGTAKWLEVAKEAAVRRAAMNYLPMLSHQQLLYLLTMSFVSGVPRSLLPGARSSRMRDRRKDERELSVKKAFLDDILNENRLLTIFRKRSGSNRVVLWDLESLPSLARVPEQCSTSTIVVTAPKDNVSSVNKNKNNQDLLRDMNLYMETVNDLYIDDNDLSGDFQLDSGSLPCVACGILGFPIMIVVQPSERASVNLLLDVGVSKHDDSHATPFATASVDPVPDGEIEPQFEKGWCSSRGFLRPRIFCLEHATHIVDILHSRGGANVLVICHSDFKKMRAHAAVISEQIGTPFRFNEVPLDNATKDDLNLIDLAVDDEQHNEYGKDWTSKINFNLQHFIKLRNSFPRKQEHQYALALGGLFSDTKSSSVIVDLKWQFTKSRTKCIQKNPFEPIRMEKPSSTENMLREKDQVLVVQSDANIIRDEVLREKYQVLLVQADANIIREEIKLIQYSRRRFKFKPGNSLVNKTVTELDCGVATGVDSGNQNKIHTVSSLKGLDSGMLGAGKASGPSIPISDGNSELQSGCGVSVSSQTVCSVTPGTQNAEGHSKDLTTMKDLDMQHGIEVDKISLNIETLDAENSSFSVVAAADETEHSIVQEEDVEFLGNGEDQSSEEIVSMKGISNFVGLVETLCENKEINDCAEDREKEPVEFNKDAPSDQSLVSNASMEISITNAVDEMDNDGHHSSPDKAEVDNSCSAMDFQKSHTKNRSKRRRELDLLVDSHHDSDGFVRSPCEGLRPRSSKHAKLGKLNTSNVLKVDTTSKHVVKVDPVSEKHTKSSVSSKHKKENRKRPHWCDREKCRMKFHTEKALSLHKRNQCAIKGCKKKFTSHYNTVLHQRVHEDNRPLKCPWKGCDMSFKWAWSRIEHIRLHTGERPYCCKVEDCGLTFRFISDYNRHRRKSGHYVT